MDSSVLGGQSDVRNRSLYAGPADGKGNGDGGTGGGTGSGGAAFMVVPVGPGAPTPGGALQQFLEQMTVTQAGNNGNTSTCSAIPQVGDLHPYLKSTILRPM